MHEVDAARRASAPSAQLERHLGGGLHGDGTSSLCGAFFTIVRVMDDTTRVTNFLTEYGEALARYDADAGVALWGSPGMVLSDDFAQVLDDPAEMSRAVSASFPLYRALGLGQVLPGGVKVDRLSDKLLQVRLTWEFNEADGTPLTTGDYLYVLRDDDEGLRVYFAIGFDEQEKIAELAERKGVDLTQFEDAAT